MSDRPATPDGELEALRGVEFDIAGARAAVAAGDAWLLDVREDDEWAAGHADAAHHVPLGELGSRVEDLPTDRAIAVICRSGARSARATKALLDAGFPAVNVAGGMQAWQADGGEVVRDDGSAGTVA